MNATNPPICAKRAKKDIEEDSVFGSLRAWLLNQHGMNDFGGLRIMKSTYGYGLFVEDKDDNDNASESEECAEVLASLPQSAVMSCAKALASPLGIACTQPLFGERTTPPPVFILQLWMALGRRDQAHPFHPYLASLPADTPSSSCWPRELRGALLSGTRLGELSHGVASQLEARCDAFLTPLLTAHPGLFTHFGAGAIGDAGSGTGSGTSVEAAGRELRSELLWACAMYESRHFPALLCPDNEEEGKEEGGEGNGSKTTAQGRDGGVFDEDAAEAARRGRPGVMLPFLDIMNHHPFGLMAWTGDSSLLRFWALLGGRRSSGTREDTNSSTAAAAAAAAAAVQQQPPSRKEWRELFNNYGGSRPNEELVLDFGFAIRNHAFDTYSLDLATASEAVAAAGADGKFSPTSSLELFELRRADHRWAQFPEELWASVVGLGAKKKKRKIRVNSTNHKQEESKKARASTSSDAPLSTEAPTTLEVKPDGCCQNEGRGEASVGSGGSGHQVQREMAAEDVEALRSLLRVKLEPFCATKARDSRLAKGLSCSVKAPRPNSSSRGDQEVDARALARNGDEDDDDGAFSPLDARVVAACRYREGQRLVLEEAIETLGEMLGAEGGEKQEAKAYPGEAAQGEEKEEEGEEEEVEDVDEVDEVELGHGEITSLAAAVGASMQNPDQYTILMLRDLLVEICAPGS